MLLNAYGNPLNATPANPVTRQVPGGRVISYGPVVPPAPAKAGRAPAYPDTYRVTVLVDNPKSGASRARFALYGAPGNTLTVGDYLAAGGKRADLAWDLTRGFIVITPAG